MTCKTILLMFAGRVGQLSAKRHKAVPISRPAAQILIG